MRRVMRREVGQPEGLDLMGRRKVRMNEWEETTDKEDDEEGSWTTEGNRSDGKKESKDG